MAAQSGVAKFVTLSGEVIHKHIYLDDVANASVRWDAGAGAGAATPTQQVFTFPVALVDVCIAAATGQTKTQIPRPNGAPDMLLNALHLASVTNRPGLALVFPAGYPIVMTQIA